MKVKKPLIHGDSYWCYKQFTAILILATVDARGIFTFVNAGNPGQVGDASAYNTSRLYRRIHSRKWLGTSAADINGVTVFPYLVGDAAFSLSPFLMKCYPDHANEPFQRTFNHRLIRTRRVVEQAFGRLKGRFRILDHNAICDPNFASDIAMVCCALHNVAERWSCPFEPSWLPAALPGQQQGHHPPADGDGMAIALRNEIANYVYAKNPVPHA